MSISRELYAQLRDASLPIGEIRLKLINSMLTDRTLADFREMLAVVEASRDDLFDADDELCAQSDDLREMINSLHTRFTRERVARIEELCRGRYRISRGVVSLRAAAVPLLLLAIVLAYLFFM